MLISTLKGAPMHFPILSCLVLWTSCFFPDLIAKSLHDYDRLETITDHVYHGPNGIEIPYEAITGDLPIFKEKDEALANLFFIAYIVEGENRPVTFVFPGGPGGACGLDAICTIGPKRLKMPAEGKKLLPPYSLIDNPESLLPWTDLVFVDPVDTGYSRFTEDAKEEDILEFFSIDGDIASLGDFIRNFVAHFERWNSPKYLFGSSYGTLRCSGLAEYLLDYDLSLHGIILLGSAMDYSTLISQRNQPLADALLIPTFAATAWYHGRLWKEAPLEEVVDYARRFCYEEYMPFLLQPNRLSLGQQNEFYQKLAQLIGLPPDTVRRYCGRFEENLYTTEFFAAERKALGGLDTRYFGDFSALIRRREDPSYRDMQGAWCAFNAYLQQELDSLDPLLPYVTYSRAYWDFSSYDSFSWPDLFQRLRRTLVYNPSMKIFSGSGYYDCRTPFAATEYCFDHLELPPSYRRNLYFKYYQAGHGFIFDLPSLQQLKIDLLEFYIDMR